MRKHLLITSLSALCVLGGSVAAWASMTAGLGPISDGVYQEWYPASSTHWTLVDDFKPCNGNTDYVTTTVAGRRDSYGISLSTVPATSTISAIEVGVCASSLFSAGTTSTIRLFYRWNGVDVFATSTYELSTSTVPVVLSPFVMFSGLSLPMSATSTLEIGTMYVTGTRGAKVSAMRAQITY